MEHNLERILELQPTQLNEGQVDFLKQNMGNLDEETITKYNLNPDANKSKEGNEGGAEGDDVEFNADNYQLPDLRQAPKVEVPNVQVEDDDFLDEESQKKFNNIVDQKLNTVLQNQSQQTLYSNAVTDAKEFVTENPDFKAYLPAVQKHLDFKPDNGSNPYLNLPAKQLFFMVAGDNLLKIGARRERELASKAKSTQSKENNAQQQPNNSKESKDYLNMSSAEFAKERSKVMQGGA